MSPSIRDKLIQARDQYSIVKKERSKAELLGDQPTGIKYSDMSRIQKDEFKQYWNEKERKIFDNCIEFAILNFDITYLPQEIYRNLREISSTQSQSSEAARIKKEILRKFKKDELNRFLAAPSKYKLPLKTQP